jgi:hypothetical protein
LAKSPLFKNTIPTKISVEKSAKIKNQKKVAQIFLYLIEYDYLCSPNIELWKKSGAVYFSISLAG